MIDVNEQLKRRLSNWEANQARMLFENAHDTVTVCQFFDFVLEHFDLASEDPQIYPRLDISSGPTWRQLSDIVKIFYANNLDIFEVLDDDDKYAVIRDIMISEGPPKLKVVTDIPAHKGDFNNVPIFIKTLGTIMVCNRAGHYVSANLFSYDGSLYHMDGTNTCTYIGSVQKWVTNGMDVFELIETDKIAQLPRNH